MTSLPSPPSRPGPHPLQRPSSFPSPPLTTSLPSRAVTESSPARAQITSSRVVPVSTSSAAVPEIVHSVLAPATEANPWTNPGATNIAAVVAVTKTALRFLISSPFLGRAPSLPDARPRGQTLRDRRPGAVVH